MRKKYERIDPAIIKLAVEELKSLGKPLTISNIADATGYEKASLYNSPHCYDYRTRSRGRHLPTEVVWHQPTLELEPSTEAYVGYLRENHFLRPEDPVDVLDAMQQDVKDLDAALWARALNLLKVGGEIKESLQKDRWVSQVKQAATTPPEAIKPAQRTEVFFVMLGDEVRQVTTMEEAEKTARELLIKANFTGEAIILNPIKRLQAQLQIIEA